MITVRSLYFFIFLAVFLVAILTTGTYYYLRYRHRQKYPYGKWENLLKRLGSLDRDNIALIARDFVDESGHRRTDEDDLELSSAEVWSLLGGMQGLEVVQKNCDVLVDLVFYVQQWYPEALLIAEQLRQNTREIQWHVGRLKGAEKTGRLESSFLEYAQRAVAIYYQMIRQVLALYEQANLPGLADLQKVL